MKKQNNRLVALLLLGLLSLPPFAAAQMAEADVVSGWREPTPVPGSGRRPCPRSLSAAAAAKSAFGSGDFPRAIEQSAEALACPDLFELNVHFELLTLRAEALHRSWRGARGTSAATNPARLIEAAAAVEAAFELLRGREILSRANSVYRRAEDQALYLVNELYNQGVNRKEAGDIGGAATAMEGAIRMMNLLPADRIDREQEVALAQAAYLTGMRLHAQGEKERSIFCLRAAVPRERALLAEGAAALRAAITIAEDQALTAYYSLGVLLYNKFVVAYNRSEQGGATPGKQGARPDNLLDGLIEETELCLRLGLLLSPGRGELQTVLDQVVQAHRLMH